MKLYNTLSRETEEFAPLRDDEVSMYSCGPTVYDHIHIGNLSAFIAADTLRRVLKGQGFKVQHVMNFTDVDDKTIRRSRETYPDLAPETALQKLTDEYKQIFLDDMRAIGNSVDDIEFVSAVDSIKQMQALIVELHKNGFAYIADDGVYFSIEKYRSSGKIYGQLSKITDSSTSSARIQNDEYDKESVHDFALWKTQKQDEPAWDFELDGHNLLGRPGWHIECSVMSTSRLGQPFDIHTGGVDLIFPHHENEIAQSTAGKDPVYAKYFVHNEHLLVNGKKMSKSLNNFYTLQDIKEKGFSPMAFRLMVLQSHYRSQANFSWENLEAAQNRLHSLYAWADTVYQATDRIETIDGLYGSLENDLATPLALEAISEITSKAPAPELLDKLDELFGLGLSNRPDIENEQKQILAERQQARDNKDFGESDGLRDRLKAQGIGVRDTEQGQVWFRL